MNKQQLPLLQEISKSTDELISFLLMALPTEQMSMKDLLKNKIFVINFLLLLGAKEKLPYLDVGIGGVAGSFPQDLSVTILPKFTAFSPNQFVPVPSVFFLLAGKLSQVMSIHLKTSKRLTKRPRPKSIEDLQQLQPKKIKFLKNDNSLYLVEEEVRLIRLDEQKYEGLLMMIEGEYEKVISVIAMNILKISKYQLKTCGVSRKVAPLLLNKSHAISSEYSLIYVQKGQILCVNQKKGYRYTVCEGNSIDVFDVEKDCQLVALQQSAVLGFPRFLLQKIMEQLPEFNLNYIRGKKQKEEVHKKMHIKMEEVISETESEKQVNYCCFHKKIKNRFSRRRNSPKFFEESQGLATFMVDAEASKAIVESKEKMLQIREEKQKVKYEKPSNELYDYLQNSQRLTKMHKAKQRQKNRLTLRNSLLFNRLKNENKSCSGFRNQVITSAINQTPPSSCQQTFLTSNDTGIIHKMLMNDAIYHREVNDILQKKRCIKSKKQNENNQEKSTRMSYNKNIEQLKKRAKSYKDTYDNGGFVLTVENIQYKNDHAPIHSMKSKSSRVVYRC